MVFIYDITGSQESSTALFSTSTMIIGQTTRKGLNIFFEILLHFKLPIITMKMIGIFLCK